MTLTSLALGQEPEMIYEDGRLKMVDYPGTADDIRYTYYDNGSVKEVLVGDGAEVYEYDRNGNLIREAYKSSPEKDREYTYYQDGSLRTVSSSESTISYKYDSNGRLKEVYTELGGAVLHESYDYYPDGSLKRVENAGGSTTYIYDLMGNVLQEIITSTVGGYSTTKVVNYKYDEEGNLLSQDDGETLPTVWEYERIPYDCLEIECLDGECADVVASNGTCYQSRIASKTVGNYRIRYLYGNGTLSYQSNTGGRTYTPTAVYDENGLLTADDYYTYEYLDGRLYKAMDRITHEVITFTVNDEGLIMQADYSSGAVEDYYYDPLDRLIRMDRTFKGKTATFYATTPGDFNTLVAKADLGGALGAQVAIPGPAVETENGGITKEVLKAAGAQDYLFWGVIIVIIIIAVFIIRSRLQR